VCWVNHPDGEKTAGVRGRKKNSSYSFRGEESLGTFHAEEVKRGDEQITRGRYFWGLAKKPGGGKN